jgi:hypothetical protein
MQKACMCVNNGRFTFQKISGEQTSRSNREGAAKDSKETIALKKLL